MPQLRDSGNDGSTAGDAATECEAKSFQRIFGIETEYGVSVTGADSSVDASHVAMAMFQPVVSRSRSTNTYLSNGSRLYLDVGSHPEYATAEACDPWDAMLQDAAGERIMRRLALDAQQRLRDQYGTGTLVHVFKNNVDSAGHSFGCHENYLVRRYVPLQAIERELLPFLISRQIFTGSGHVNANGFTITQRAEYMDESVSSATTRSRPMVNTRDEPHADPGQFRRLHVIIGDSNRSQWATMMKLATTHLVLCVIEYAARQAIPSGFEGCALHNPTQANESVSRDISGLKPTMALEEADLFVEHGGEHHDGMVSAVHMQRHYLRVVKAFWEDHRQEIAEASPHTDYATVLAQWQQVLDLLEEGDITSLSEQVDWAAKLRLITGMQTRNSELPQARLIQLDMDYHDIANGKVYEALVNRHIMQELLDEQQVRYALTHAPSDTRAALRGAFVQAAMDAGVRFSCDWTQLAILEGQRSEVVLLDPFSAQPTPQYRQLLALVRRGGSMAMNPAV
ncbi:MAG: proteasome accessory factor PafA2 family protein [Bifidobacterium tsurumiense]|uniref:proteasome accessory factor PafA2 family protein n=1 Tax=Bifidobacterium tsurumiense TaxID=356829 RepID=UPI002A7F39F9|nr:proteasome accessory factor PafA2 family protein [Bifidobacterium tsurumiense]MDY4677286.1 proteasome accessory factor PafA2 family protein [Bifidobacterium tsurumiense]